jgi:hypothetical protein
MMRWFGVFILMFVLSIGAAAAPKGPQVDMIDNKLSVSADGVSLSQLLHLVDLATGMQSKVPPELATRRISVRFSGLNMTDAVRKLFQGQPLDYVMVAGQGIIVTAASQATSGVADTGGQPFNQPMQQQMPQMQPMDQPFAQDFPQPGMPFPGQQGQQPMVQTPFGPIPNPRAQQPNGPMIAPGQPQQNSLFPNQPANQQQPIQVIPGLQPGNPSPFGTPSPFGGQQVPQQGIQNNGLFGTPSVFPTTGAQPR